MKQKNVTRGMMMATAILSLGLLASCTDDVDEMKSNDTKQLAINVGVNQTDSRASITGNALDDGEQVGVSFVDETGFAYMNNDFNNICFTGATVDGTQVWTAERPIITAEKTGTVYAYYPYTTALDMEDMQIEIATQTDYMYATPVTGINETNSIANVKLNHILSNIRLNFINNGYLGEGNLKSISIYGEGIATTGSFNVYTGEYNSTAGEEEEVTDNTERKLGDSSVDLMVVPNGENAEINVELVIDDNKFTAKTGKLTLVKGNSYVFNLNVNDTELEIPSFTVNPWVSNDFDEPLQVEKIDEFKNAIMLQYYVDETSLASRSSGVEMNIFSSNSNFKIEDVDKVSIDGVEVTPSLKHTFTTSGYHNVKVLLKNVESIPAYIFYDLDNLVSIYIPSIVNSINASAFQGCSLLNKISVDEDNVTFNSKDNCNAIIHTEDNVLLLGCKNTVIPNDVVGIGIKAFYGCEDLSKIIIPESVKEYGDYAFSRANNFHPSITDNQSVVKIGNYAFYECKIEGPVVFSDVLEEVGTEIFGYGTGAGTVVFGTGIKKVGMHLFGSSHGGGTIRFRGMVQPVVGSQGNSWNITDIVIPDGAINGYWDGFENNNGFSNFSNIREEHSIEENGFLFSADKKTIISYSGNASSLSIPEGVEQLYSEVFYNKEDLVYVQFPSSLKRIGRLAFSYTGLMGEITVPNSVTTIDDRAFSSCEDLTVINLGTGLEHIGNNAFADCSALTRIIIPNTVRNIGGSAFVRCSLLSEFTIPGSLTTIEKNTFSGCDGLTDITIPSNVTGIGEGAFSGCDGLTNVTIGSGVQTIGKEAFSKCTKLASIDLGSSIQTISALAFFDCSSLAQINIKAESAPIITSETFRGIKENGVIIVPPGKKEVYAYWMKTESYYLGYLNWTIQEADE